MNFVLADIGPANINQLLEGDKKAAQIKIFSPDSFIFFYPKKYIFVAVLTKHYNYGGHRSKS